MSLGMILLMALMMGAMLLGGHASHRKSGGPPQAPEAPPASAPAEPEADVPKGG